ATPRWPPGGEPLVAPPTKQQCFAAHRLIEREVADPWTVLDQADPAAAAEALITGRVLDDSVERDVLADDDLAHLGLMLCRRSGAKQCRVGQCSGKTPERHVCSRRSGCSRVG